MQTKVRRSPWFLLLALLALGALTIQAHKGTREAATRLMRAAFNREAKLAATPARITSAARPASKLIGPVNPARIAQGGGTFNITYSDVITGGGSSTGGVFALTDSIGQLLSGSAMGGTFTLVDGFQGSGGTEPTITASAPLTRQQGSPATNAQIATVNDAEQAGMLSTLTVMATTLTGSGVTISNIVVNNSGAVTADVVAACTAVNSTFTLTVTDNTNLTGTAVLTVNVTANSAPVQGTYSATSIPPGGGTTVMPSTAPTDNGSVVSVTVAPPLGFTGSFSGNATTGVITISNAAPVGSYMVTVTATDNCGLTSTRTFTLTVGAQTITVNDTADDALPNGNCTLREAIQAANTNLSVDACATGSTGLNIIEFSIPGGGTPTINVLTALPTVTESIDINGATGGATRIELNGGGLGAGRPGLHITAGNSNVRALVINRFSGAGIQIATQGGNTIQNCLIGVNAAELAALANATGILIDNTSNNTIGGTGANTRNVIAGNENDGIKINGLNATGNLVLGNSIGTNAAGTIALGNNQTGVNITGAPTNRIGGNLFAERNLISGNNLFGISISDAAAAGNEVLGNFIGTNAAGTAALPNGTGVRLVSAPNNKIGDATGTTPGGACTGACNLISGNNEGVRIEGAGATGNTIRGNLIGTRADGTMVLPNTAFGVRITDAPSTVIGGSLTGQRNVISGNSGVNGANISISGALATGQQILGNFIGTNAAGTAGLSNGGNGVEINGSMNNIIGGTTPAARNVISGHTNGAGVSIVSASNNQVRGNYIGTNAAGTSAIANSFGISRIESAIGTGQQNAIGGANEGEGNLISGNTSAGIQLRGQSDRVQGNRIGTNAAGTAAIPNGIGINLNNGTAINNLIGDTDVLPGSACTGKCNKIAFNTTHGVLITTNANIGNRILGNSIFSNGALGIDLGPMLGVTPNDNLDGDAGPNGLQNFPVLTAVLTLGNEANRTTTFQGTLNSTPNTLYRIDFYANMTCDPTGNGEGQTFLGFTNVMTHITTGNATINVTLPTPFGIAAGDFVTATATEVTLGNTSEFSACVPVFGFNLAAAAFTRFANTGTPFTFTTAPSAAWTVASSVPWITVTSSPMGTGNTNNTVTYSLAANPDTKLRTGTISVAGNLFIVTQTGTTGTILLEDFAGATFQPSANWTITDGGANGGVEARWTNQNPCGQTISFPMNVNGTFAIMDANCAGPDIQVLDEYLFTPPFNATGLGTVVVEFFNVFKASDGLQKNRGDVDVSTDGGFVWTTVKTFQNTNVGTNAAPTTESIDITTAVMNGSGPANILVRMHYYSTGAPRPTLLADSSKSMRRSPRVPHGEIFGYWAVDFTIEAYGISPLAANFVAAGATGMLAISTPAATVPPTPRTWSVVSSDNSWLTVTPPASGSGDATVSYQVANNPAPAPRTGTLTVTGANNFMATHTVTQAGGCSTITINPTNPALPNGRAGVAYNQTFTQTGATTPTFSLSAGSLPTGLTLTGAVLSGTPTVNGTFNFTIKATDTNSCMGTQAYTLLIQPPCPSITVNPATLVNGFVGTAYSQTLTATGGTAPHTFAVTAGSLPGGLNLASSGALNGTPTAAGTFTFTVTATDNTGCTGMRSYTVIVSGNGLLFYPLPSPVRLLDTRNFPGVSGCTTAVGALAANATRTQPARTVCSTIPAQATAIIGNITVIPAGPGFLTLFPSDAAQPTVANSNFKAGEITNNFFTVGLGAGAGAFKIFSSATTEVIIDVTGYYAPPGAANPGGLYYHPLPNPVRLVETRASQAGCFQPPQLVGTNDPNANPALDLQVQGRGPGLPTACNSLPNEAVVLVGNATTVFPNAPFGVGYLTIYPSDASRPTVASSNYATNDIINGPFAVKLGADGRFKVYTFSTTDLVIDITGYYSTSANDANGAGLLFTPLPKPMRLLETRDFAGLTGCYTPRAAIQGGPGGIRTQPAWGPCADQAPLTIPTTARALVGNATVINPVGAGFGTFFPGDLGVAPTVATTNFPFPVVFGYNRHYYVGLSPGDGTFKILTQFTSDYIVDVSGYFAP